jgi:hypothetical protein
MAGKTRTATSPVAADGSDETGDGTSPDDVATVATRETPSHMEFTKKRLDALCAVRPHKQRVYWDTAQDGKGLCVLVSRGPKGGKATVTFRVLYYLQGTGKPQYLKIGRYPDDSYSYPYKNETTKKYDVIKCSDIEAVRTAASDIRNRAKLGIDPKRKVLSGNFADMVDSYFEDHKNRRTWEETRHTFDVFVISEWADKDIEKITKSDVKQLLSKITARKIKSAKKGFVGGAASARTVRSKLAAFFNWYVAGHSADDYRSPVVKLESGSPLTKADARSRVLSDDEIRAMWIACGEMGAYGALVKTSLLVAQRFRKVAQMRRSDLKDRVTDESTGKVIDIGGTKVWNAARIDDPKNKRVSAVPLSRLALDIISKVTEIDGDGDFVFSVNGRTPLKGWSAFKLRLDASILALLRSAAEAKGDDPDAVELKPWQHRDLRRTARTLMADLGVADTVAEQALAHALPVVHGTYNKHHYLPEKKAAFALLAERVESIVTPPSPEGSNVVVGKFGGAA